MKLFKKVKIIIVKDGNHYCFETFHKTCPTEKTIKSFVGESREILSLDDNCFEFRAFGHQNDTMKEFPVIL